VTLSSKQPVVFVVDDDPVFRVLILQVLKKFGLRGEAFSEADAFFSATAKNPPHMFLVDLNLESTHSGLAVVQRLRELYRQDIPIFVVSATTDAEAIAHAIEIGADDYIFKPLDREVFASKLMNYLESDQLSETKLDFLPEVAGECKGTLQVEFQIGEIDELGLTVASRHLISKGTVLKVSGPWIAEVSGRETPILVTVASSWIDPAQSTYEAYLEFDPLDEELSSKVRAWITRKNTKSNK